MSATPQAAAESLDFDPRVLADFLKHSLDGATGPMSVERIGGGQSNPTFFVSFPDRRLVLRKRPSGPTLPSAHAVDREYRVLRALEHTPVPVPKALLFRAEPDVVGTPFYVMERLEGRVFHDSALPGIAPQERSQIYLAMADALAALHAVDPAAVGLADYGKPGSYFARQLSRWSRQWRESPTKDIPALDELVVWLDAHLPQDTGRSAIAHGDYRLGNLMFDPREPCVVAILDWELSTLGDPLADLGYCCMTWHMRPDEYAGIMGLDHRALGIPSQADFVERYERSAGTAQRLKTFHIVFALFRFAVIFVGIADRARAGTAAATDAAQTGQLAGNFAQRALDLALRRSDGASAGRGE
jgi:aminoglycoside phosphotransferase (APT) family kinase protein